MATYIARYPTWGCSSVARVADAGKVQVRGDLPGGLGQVLESQIHSGRGSADESDRAGLRRSENKSDINEMYLLLSFELRLFRGFCVTATSFISECGS
jgi:hypothetical protein